MLPICPACKHAEPVKVMLSSNASCCSVTGQLDVCIICGLTCLNIPTLYTCKFQRLALAYVATVLHTERVCAHCWCALTNF